jgi:hypothetical protein
MNVCEPAEAPYLCADSSPTKPPLRIGLLLPDSFRLNCAAAHVIREIDRSDFAQLELIVCGTGRHGPSLTNGIWNERGGPPHQERTPLLWRLYRRFDRRVGGAEVDPLATADCESILNKVDRVKSEKEVDGSGECAADLAAIYAKDLDVLLRFGFETNDGAIAKAARFGIWSLHYADYDYYRGGPPPYFWELYEGNVLSGLTLVVSDELGVCRVLAKALFSTELGLSVRRNEARPFVASSQLVMGKLWELHAYGWGFVRRRSLPSTPYLGKKESYRAPTNTEMVRWFVPQATVKLCRRAKWALTNSEVTLQWRIAIRTGGRFIFGRDGEAQTDGFQWLDAPKGHFYADPFVVVRDGQHWLFFEDYEDQRRLGRIACAAISTSGDMGEVRIVLEAASHLSYPHIFADGGSLYMIPESGSELVVRLYRCVNFPEQWTPIAELFHGPAFDTSVFHYNGLWWFFTTLQDRGGHGVALYLFFSESLTGRWQYHPANPISYDVRNARGAGRLFESEGKLIRPSQSGIIRYGYSFALNEIVMLTPSEYRERPMLTVEPFGDLMATHTYNREGLIEAIDGQRPIRVSRRRRSTIMRRAAAGGMD